jgi:hypothetical protein
MTEYILNCTNCAYSEIIETDAYMNVDYTRELHEESIRNALAIGPNCPEGAVAIAQTRTRNN